MKPLSTELILIRVTGEDRPGLTASVTEILAKYDATILDIGQADIHNTLSLGILCKTEEQHSGFIMKELLFKASSLGVTIRFYPITAKEYEDWVSMQGKNWVPSRQTGKAWPRFRRTVKYWRSKPADQEIPTLC